LRFEIDAKLVNFDEEACLPLIPGYDRFGVPVKKREIFTFE
jgi:hypothetical protein